MLECAGWGMCVHAPLAVQGYLEPDRVEAELVLMRTMPGQNCLCAVYFSQRRLNCSSWVFLAPVSPRCNSLAYAGRQGVEPKAQSQVSVYWSLSVVAWHPWVSVQRSQLALSDAEWSAVRAKALFYAI